MATKSDHQEMRVRAEEIESVIRFKGEIMMKQLVFNYELELPHAFASSDNINANDVMEQGKIQVTVKGTPIDLTKDEKNVLVMAAAIAANAVVNDSKSKDFQRTKEFGEALGGRVTNSALHVFRTDFDSPVIQGLLRKAQ